MRGVQGEDEMLVSEEIRKWKPVEGLKEGLRKGRQNCDTLK